LKILLNNIFLLYVSAWISIKNSTSYKISKKAGSAFIYAYINSAWSYSQQLLPTDIPYTSFQNPNNPYLGFSFGWSVAMFQSSYKGKYYAIVGQNCNRKMI
jgi:hypothetical protein